MDKPEIHVWEWPEGGMDAWSRWCDEATPEGADVIFHRDPQRVGEEWSCGACGMSTASDAGEAH